MEIYRKLEVQEWVYKNNEEFKVHREAMQKLGWVYQDNYIVNKIDICARYIHVVQSSLFTVADALKTSKCKTLLIKTVDGEVAYNDSVRDILRGNRIVDRLLLKEVVSSKTEQNDILTVVIKR